ncbi:tRNA pseudouridine synthase B [Candidatus Kinetoplastibacterium sorsogonicusi]|uniref:tRNA pseudouridine synthase B n=1 Tax=Candidatus Kinetoplastidibacterium kentomonadis TaxID=1576550 RepID=A0A3Q8EX12_9PROT|nr:tRNA pseudouridine(55) synthase TruB [Candidatus Kinetoplastibacterium sorsogonicusi]AWD32510.1 tRNA pseudouridine synthase B [Candidatus Kinetoplastibacterium sorsogonicusi]
MSNSLYNPINKILLLDKNINISSNNILQYVKKIVNAKKAGHTGTLDPFATGLLICCFDAATKISKYFLNSNKTYIATIQLGSETDTCDLTGKIIKFIDLENFVLNENLITDIISTFHGEIEQIPPMFSAIKKSGIPLYKYARKGINFEITPRKIFIYKILILNIQQYQITIEITCSKGTYIRALARDIGQKLGCFAHLLALRRTHIDHLSVNDAITLETLKKSLNPKEFLRNIDDILIINK